MELFNTAILLILLSSVPIKAAPKAAISAYEKAFCKEEWIKQKCLHDCGEVELCTEWVHEKCEICNFSHATPAHQEQTSSPMDKPTTSSPNQDSQQDHRFCSEDWVKYKCAFDCKEKNLCTSGLYDQCATCNFDADTKSVEKNPQVVNPSAPEYVHSFCDAQWLKHKCQYDCEDKPELCTPWVQGQCNTCNFR
jgi:hypothetical protein